MNHKEEEEEEEKTQINELVILESRNASFFLFQFSRHFSMDGWSHGVGVIGQRPAAARDINLKVFVDGVGYGFLRFYGPVSSSI